MSIFNNSTILKQIIFGAVFLWALTAHLTSFAQQRITELKWKEVVYTQPDEWYGSEEAIRIAENVLLYQRNIGGWPKDKPMHLVLTKHEKEALHKLQTVGIGATTDNGATIMQLDYLSKVYAKTKVESYKKAFLKGIDYLLEAQYKNGGWPQFYPLEKGDYSTRITYNDRSMVNIMDVLKAIADKSDRFSIEMDKATVLKANTAFEKGVAIILKTQYKQDGILTAWCAQHDEYTLKPAKARSYELPSLSGDESADIVMLLMKVKHPSAEIINAIQSAVAWFDKVKIERVKIQPVRNKEGVKDRIVIKDKNAPLLWARFYDLKDNRPFFCDRDGIKKYALAEIGHERRNNYSWYTDDPIDIYKRYHKWQLQWAPGENMLNKVRGEKNCLATTNDEQAFNQLLEANWETVFSDDCTGDWTTNWSLDGKIGYVENSSDGMALHAGPELKNDAHHAVLWTKQSFSGDLMIEYDYNRLDDRNRQVNIIYIQATGFEEGAYSKDIFEWNALREVPAMSSYYNYMHVLHVSYAAFDAEGDYIRARRYRPDRHNKKENTELGASYNTGFFKSGVKHHITIIKKDYDLYMKVSNKKQTMLYKWNYSEHPKILEGRIGLRQMFARSSRYKNFVVKELK